ncbi:hypothetical protein ACWEPC_27480 [Nonomuraea sp. NPDC004297]
MSSRDWTVGSVPAVAPHNVNQTLDVLTAAQDVTPPEAQAFAMCTPPDRRV